MLNFMGVVLPNKVMVILYDIYIDCIYTYCIYIYHGNIMFHQHVIPVIAQWTPLLESATNVPFSIAMLNYQRVLSSKMGSISTVTSPSHPPTWIVVLLEPHSDGLLCHQRKNGRSQLKIYFVRSWLELEKMWRSNP